MTIEGGSGGLGSGGLGSGGVVGGGAVGPGPALGSGGGGFGGLLGPHGVAALGLGGLTGVVAMGGLIAAGIVQPHPRSPTPSTDPNLLALVTCPGSGAIVANAAPGDQMLLTGRSADGSWVQVYIPGPVSHGWAPKGLLTIDGDPSTLPEVDCGQVAVVSPSPEITATPSVSPSESATPSPTPTPTPTPKVTPTPTPTPKPNSAPVLAGLKSSTGLIQYPVAATGCNLGPKSARISVTATDSDGIASVTLFFRKPGASSYQSRSMTKSGSTYSAPVSVSSDGLTKSGTLAYYAVATDKDAKPASTRSGSKSISIKKCNLPPQYINADMNGINVPVAPATQCPIGTPTTANIVILASDPDGTVSSVAFWFLPYGSSTWHHINLAFGGNNLWQGEVHASSFKPLPKAGLYHAKWYVKITDNVGAVTKTGAQTTYPEASC